MSINEIVPYNSQDDFSYLNITASPKKQSPVLNKINPRKAPKYLFVFNLFYRYLYQKIYK